MFGVLSFDLYAVFQSMFPYLKHFQTYGFSIISLAILKGQSLQISEISRHLEANASYKQNRKRVERFFANPRFSISLLQKQYLRFLFTVFFHFHIKKKIEIIIDYTDFSGYRILHAGVPFSGRVFPIYFKIFSIKRKHYDLSTIETSVLRNLFMDLPREYRYIVVADRGFGHEPFIRLCEGLGFGYVLRIKESLSVTTSTGKLVKVSSVKRAKMSGVDYKGHKTNLAIVTRNGSTWYLLSSEKSERVVKIYEKRFWTEEYFRDIKTYFKARNLRYSIETMKRLLFLGQICYNLVFEIGIKEKIDTDFYSASTLSFFPAGMDPIPVQTKENMQISKKTYG